MEDGNAICPDSVTQGEVHLWNHFIEKHSNLNSLFWLIIDEIGKETKDPSGNLLRWEHAYIEHFKVKFPNGLNRLD